MLLECAIVWAIISCLKNVAKQMQTLNASYQAEVETKKITTSIIPDSTFAIIELGFYFIFVKMQWIY